MNRNLIALTFVLACLSSAVLCETAQPQAAQPHHEEVSTLLTLTDQNFNNYVTNTSTSFVMFYAPWCPHCKNAMPAVGDLSKALSGKVNVGTVDCDDNSEVKGRFSVPGYPTFMLLKNGKMYPYKGPRTVEAWTKFIDEGYKTVEGETIPTEASVLRNTVKEFKNFFEQLKFAAKQQPLVFGGIFACFFILVALTCFCGGSEEKAQPQAEEKKDKKAEEKTKKEN